MTEYEMVRVALTNDDIVVHYQPIVDMNGCIVAIEALARCRDAAGTIRLPADFLDAILGTRLMSDLDHVVLSKALDFAVVLRDTVGVRAPWVACNVSATSLSIGGRASVILGELSSRGLSPDQLGLEITESAAFEVDDETLLGLTQLREAGVHIALDDFGTGYSSLSHLVTLPLSILKIDKSFIDRIDRGGAEHAIAQAVTSLAGALGLTVVAEGVETAAQERSVRAMGVDHLQGWTSGAAVDAREIMVILSRSEQACPSMA